ncbi:hypothetical protein [Bacillus coahuilensis]|uniref:hypothetical protein n=1 Tax=Bacillus coahuilensis TaxID=408580 RepID=UPI000B2E2960|nr:hypothetical protein [Bacillus coahuilensis]
MSERSTYKSFGIPTLLQGAILLFLCPVILFNGMYILNNGFVFQEGVAVGKLFALAGM